MSDQTQIGDDTVAIPQNEGSGGRVGPFKILQQIGEGGFGSVFEAEQEHPVKRRVALKIIKLGMDTREVITRFEAERQALAMMDHPNIARVLDAGATASGRPYFVMELVKGEPISAYCNRHKLPIDARLRLFEQVCAAVQHAHTKGIIHRDLKPSNVLVSTQDDQPFAKVIDFGIAKATSGRLTDKTMFTEANLMMGTPLYMSPEQAEGSADIDMRTDIYSLGVILYELLTDTTPLDSNTLRSAGYAEVQRIIREVEPLRPSARLSSSVRRQSITTRLGAEAHSLGEPHKLVKMLKGELDWIVMKAIEKDRARRYETANALAADVRRYLDGEAVLAAPPSVSYQLQKFVRRHKGTVAAGALVTAALLAGVAGFAWQAHIAQQQTLLAQRQTQLAQQRSNELDKVAKFEATMLGQVNPIRAGKLLSADVLAKFAAAQTKAGVPDAIRVVQLAAFTAQWQQVNATDAARDLIDSTILKPAVVGIDKQFKDQPQVDAKLRQTLANCYFGMGLFDAALPLQQSALATHRRVLGDDDPITLDSMIGMGAVLERLGKPTEAEPYAREALQRTRRVLGEDNPKTVLALSLVGLILYEDGRLRETEAIYREGLAIQRRVLGENNPTTLAQIHNLGLLLMYEHKLVEAEPFLREAVERSPRVMGEENPAALMAVLNYGYLLEHEGKLDEAARYERDGLEKARRALGENHPVTLTAVFLTGMVLEKKGEHAAAEKVLLPADTATRDVFTGSNVFLRASYLLQLGLARTGLGNFAAAESELLEAQSILRQTHNVTHDDDIRDCTHALVALYTAWHKAEPGKGYDAKAAEWKRTLAALGATGAVPPTAH